MKKRCLNPNSTNYSYYGGRGISVSPLWKDNFYLFKKWAISNGYSNLLTLDRISSNGNYEPENCRWATKTEQSNNRRDTRYITTPDGKITIRDLSILHDIPIKKAQDLYDNHGNNYIKLLKRINVYKQKQNPQN